MKKALLAGLYFVLVSFALVGDTFALPDIQEVFHAVADLMENGIPEMGGEGTAVHVQLVSDGARQNLIPGGRVSSASRVQNLGGGEVYFRLAYAIQYDAATWNKLSVSFDAGNGFREHDWQDISVSGTPYKMKVFTYTQALPVQSASPDVRISIAMDSSVTSEQLARYRGDFLQMQALAVDPTPFLGKGYLTAEAALDAALPLRTLNPF